MSVDTGRLLAAFETAFGRSAEVLGVAPGRVNLIGEHTDYNEGLVLPVAIDRTVAVAAARLNDGVVSVQSLDYGERDEFRLDGIAQAAGWRNYARGVAWALQKDGRELQGAALAVSGDVPQGAGLSSSAAIEVAVAGALAAAAGLELPIPLAARLARRAENEFVGVPCGIMDQFASGLARAGHALLVDCRTEDVEHIPLPFDAAGVRIVIVDSRVPRRLADTAYAQRQQECREAAALLGVESLRDADGRTLEQRGCDLPEDLRRRARHVVSENARVAEAVRALSAGDIAGFGELMYRSHQSLRDDFLVSCGELDRLVDLASRADGVLGARLTGAGFGGCTVNLVREDCIDAFHDMVVQRYRHETALAVEMHVCRSVDGLRVTDV